MFMGNTPVETKNFFPSFNLIMSAWQHWCCLVLAWSLSFVCCCDNEWNELICWTNACCIWKRLATFSVRVSGCGGLMTNIVTLPMCVCVCVCVYTQMQTICDRWWWYLRNYHNSISRMSYGISDWLNKFILACVNGFLSREACPGSRQCEFQATGWWFGGCTGQEVEMCSGGQLWHVAWESVKTVIYSEL